jgi:hypothetical protein
MTSFKMTNESALGIKRLKTAICYGRKHAYRTSATINITIIAPASPVMIQPAMRTR